MTPSGPTASELLELYDKLGWALLPIHRPTQSGCSCRATRCSRAGRHAVSVRSVGDAWRGQVARGRRNVAVRTGGASGLVAITVTPTRAATSLGILAAAGRSLASRLHMRAASGADVFLFEHPSRYFELPSREVMPGIRFVGEDDFVILPPSLHSNSRVYRWVLPPTDCAAPDALPYYWLERATVRPPADASLLVREGFDVMLTRYREACRARGERI